jgi:predicted CXXCH cytochrome family protein
MSEGDHHVALDRHSCVDCHNPHGGSDQFFLKRAEP